MRKRIKYSQNLLINPKLVPILLDKTSLTESDIVIEIGPGNGIITDELLKTCKRVIAVEIDKNLYSKLLNRFENNPNIELINQDFLEFPLPDYQYKVFSNIPFSSSSEMVRKLVFSDNPPEDTYLFYQEEAAKHLISRSLLSIIIGVNFEVSIIHEFRYDNFVPKPGVHVILLRIKKIESKIPKNKQEKFNDFLTYFYNQPKPNISQSMGKVVGKEKINNFAQQNKISYRQKPSELTIDNWITIFNFFTEKNPEFFKKIEGTYSRLQNQQRKLQKIHRTRKDLEWRSK
jgi:23S rRNA (adenine-N6)-dimethyltransferase